MDPKKYQSYIDGWRKRRTSAQQEINRRAQLSRAAAQSLAEHLRTRWGAEDVYLFGSLARWRQAQPRSRPPSDIDLAVTGIDPELYYMVYSDLDRTSPLPVDLILLEDCPVHLKEAILRDGIRL